MIGKTPNYNKGALTMRTDEKAKSKTLRKTLYFQAVESKDYGTKAYFFTDDDDSIYVHYQISISRIKTAAGIREARLWNSMVSKLKKGDRVLAAVVKRQMNNCEYAETAIYYNVDKILKVF